MSNALMDIENMSIEELNLLQDKILIKKTNDLERQVKELSDQLKKQTKEKEIFEQEVETKFTRMNEDMEKKTEVAINSMRVSQSKEGYISQGDFGRYFDISVGARTVGKLLKVVGLAQRVKGSTKPYRRFIPKYAQIQTNKNFDSVKWNFENCITYIEKWFKDNNYFEEFYSIATEKERQKFIDKLYKEHIEEAETA